MTDTKTMVAALNVIADELQAMEGSIQAQCIRDAAAQLADMQKTIEQLIAGKVPDGWKLVPIEPTREMQRAYFDVIDANEERVKQDCTFGRYTNNKLAYKAMIDAAPVTEIKDGD